MNWTDELRAEVIEKYKAAEPTPETSIDIVKKIADEYGDDVVSNGIRGILVKAEVYIKATPTTKSTANGKTASTRVNKADAQEALTNLIESLGIEADQDIITKLTGKAAIYLVETFKAE